MARFAANLTYLFTEMPMLQRFAAAKRAGFRGVEILFPYDLAVKELSQAAQAAGVEFVLMNTPPPNWAGGPRGFAAEPGNESRFRGDFDRALRFGRALGVKHLHVMAGKAQGGLARRTFVENLKWACARDARTSLTIEPMNRNDMPGYFLDSFELAAEILDEVGAPNLGLQFDVYHAQMIHRDALTVWQRHAPRVRHIQISDWPSRHEPRQGDIDFAELFHAIDAAGYRGWVSAEYTPRSSTEAGLRWLRLA
ncbi:hydroxypyruvate isomerase family protein [Paracoccus sp. P2]|uniref:TIM barrel protein n=1 Tax=Paracoccus pantotrophus TaxID=82367 RepID=A0A7H9BRW0_PARPN|nr:TIM barrel protein [Paracoccus pantotrophus]MDF3852877.1 TIM barrel protein [Paracoccus pantotrophus]QLH14032.1 TIM barrel protein [Paracoccus pantotrophus]RNI17355.1 hydroxypyruvate isomerase [Paracoccus pantotrophus]SFN89500.1 hydroxypyruvate isomerase [Paracoccus pantotrophus]